MKIHRLDLTAYGIFTDLQLDLSPPGLHVVVGPNEAGKSTVLSAISDLLFGIHPRTQYGFLHDNPSLTLGARLADDEQALEIVRRKRNKQPILTPEGKPLDQETLDAFLRGVDRDFFETMFGLSHRRLQEGGQEILQGKGDLGQSLFTAYYNTASYGAALKHLEQRAEALHKPRGSQQRLPKAVTEHIRLGTDIAAKSLRPGDYVAIRKELLETEQALLKLQEKERSLGETHEQLRRLKNAMVPFGCRRELETRIREVIAEGPLFLRPNAKEDLRDIRERIRSAEKELEHRSAAVKDCHSRMEGLSPDLQLIAHQREIEDLHQRAGAYREGIDDRPELVTQLKMRSDAALKLLSSLGAPNTLDEARGSLTFTVQQAAHVRELAGEASGVRTEVETARSAFSSGRLELKDAETAFAERPQPSDPLTLKSIIQDAARRGDLDGALAEARDEVMRLEATCLAQLESLGMEGPIDEVQALPVPTEAWIEEQIERWADRARHLDVLQDQIKQAESESALLDHEVAALKASKVIPSKEDLERARGTRNEGWGLVKHSWLEGVDSPEDVRQFAGEIPLHVAYEQAVSDADKVADALYQEASDVEKLAGLIAQLKECKKRQVEAIEARAVLEAKDQEVRSAWARDWRVAGVNGESPRALREWIRAFKDFRTDALALKNARQQLEDCAGNLNELKNRLLEELKIRDVAPNAEASLSTVIAQAQAVLERVQEDMLRAKELAKKLKEAKRRFEEQQSKLDDANAKKAAWDASWAEAVEQLGLKSDATPAQAHDFLSAVDRFRSLDEQIADTERRIAGIDERSRGFHSRVARLVESVAPELVKMSPDDAIDLLQERLHQASQDASDLKNVRERLQEEQTAHKAAARVRAEEGRALDGLLSESGLGDIASLTEAVERGERLSGLKKELERTEDELLRSGEGWSLEEVLRKAEDAQPEELAPSLEVTGRYLEECRTAITDTSARAGALRDRLEKMDGSEEAARLEELRQRVWADIEEVASEYLATAIALTLLNEQLKAFREERQGPILRGAQHLFERITLGRYPGLESDETDSGHPVLRAINAEGRRVDMAGLSDGTSDGLYFALRFSALQQYLKEHEPMPLVLDDIFVNFDEARTKCGLEILQDFSSDMQVVLFTHHRHVADLASALNSVTIHELHA